MWVRVLEGRYQSLYPGCTLQCPLWQSLSNSPTNYILQETGIWSLHAETSWRQSVKQRSMECKKTSTQSFILTYHHWRASANLLTISGEVSDQYDKRSIWLIIMSWALSSNHSLLESEPGASWMTTCSPEHANDYDLWFVGRQAFPWTLLSAMQLYTFQQQKSHGILQTTLSWVSGLITWATSS